MTDTELTTLSTLVWLVATVSLFVLLAEWSDGATWGLTSAIVHGMLGWSDGDSRRRSVVSPHAEPLRPILDPYASLRRKPRPRGSSLETARPARVADVEIIEFGERRLG